MSESSERRGSLTPAVAVALLLSIVAACGDDAEGSEPDDPAPAITSVETAPDTSADHDQDHDQTHDPDHDAGHDVDPMSVVIDGVDFGFENVPATVPAGTRLGFRNTSSTELHELVAFRLETDMALGEMLLLPPDELEATLGAPVTVLLQPPGAPEAIEAVGDGTLSEPGRYVLMCFIPIGADPDEYLAAVAAAGGGKPDGVAGGPPHFTAGMYAEVTVE